MPAAPVTMPLISAKVFILNICAALAFAVGA
jgi:hypothetical protein